MTIYATSPSALELYASCPYCWYLKITGKPQQPTEAMKFGIRLHAALQQYHQEVYVPEFSPDLQPYLDEYMKVYDQEYQICETFWSVPLFDTGINLKMKLDLVKDDFIIDHKTSAREYSQQYVDKMRQLTFYSYGWRQQYTEPETGVRVNLFFTDRKPGEELLEIINSSRQESDFEELKEWVMPLLEGIENDQFEPNERGRFHNFPDCPFFKEP